ncbi:MAG: DUF559 domain-containing protein [Actinobacteria bacterium]|nr:DUF559 domain-containing protein [Actinomycetota bacterium]
MSRPEDTTTAAHRAKRNRRHLTISEARLWGAIKGGATGARFRRQVPVGPWIVDFATLRPKLVVEVDDTSHEYRDEISRTRFIEGRGFKILRFTNREVALELPEVFNTIEGWVAALRGGYLEKNLDLSR